MPHPTPTILALADAGPGWADFLRVVTLADHNTRVVVIGTTLLGLASGVVGAFMLLRKRALVGDALSHAALPGIGVAFLAATWLGRDGKSLPLLLAGATVSAVLGMATILAIRHLTRIKEDAALAIVLSVYFGAGVCVVGLIQKLSAANAAGLDTFIYGKTASMLKSDAILIGVAATAATLTCVLLFKEFTLLCFDQGFAASRGWPVGLLDALLMAMVILVTVVGLQAVGLILVIALLVIPPAAARFWSDRLSVMVACSALLGALSGWIGASASALWARLPAGAVIVLVAAGMFIISMLFGPGRGVIAKLRQSLHVNSAVGRQNLLRAMYERIEADRPAQAIDTATASGVGVTLESLVAARSWSARTVGSLLRSAMQAGLVDGGGAEPYRLTMLGLTEARRVVRNHRLWEVFLLTHADIAPTQVDRAADRIEHVLGPEMITRLERFIAEGTLEQRQAVPADPLAPRAEQPIAPGEEGVKP